MCVRTHVLFNSYLMYVNHFNTFLMSEACLGAYTLPVGGIKKTPEN